VTPPPPDRTADGTQGETRPGEPWSKAFDWIEANLGGRILSYERQPRWRPAFYLEFERDGETLQLYVRGARTEVHNGETVLEHESRVLQQLEKDGIPVPHVYGYCPEPAGIVMERSPGRENLATADSKAEAQAVLDEYIDILARTHALDTAPYEAFGMQKPVGAEALGLCDLASWEGPYRKAKSRPEPIIEFSLSWLKRNIPKDRSEATFLSADAGQFLFENGRITTLIDLELACLGDPAADLAGMRGRDLSEPLGDLAGAFERYFKLRGDVIPASVIDFHTVRFDLYTPMAIAPIVANPDPSTDIIQYLGWYWVWSRACLEVMAATLGIELDPPTLPEPEVSRFAGIHDALTQRLKNASDGEDFAAYETDAAYRTSEYLRRVERYGRELEQNDLDEVGKLLGRSFNHWTDADRELEQLIETVGAKRDEDLIRLFHRRTLRHESLLQPVLRELEGVSTQLLEY
jgi:hypothetical protein